MKLFVALEIQHFQLKIFSFNSYVYYVTRGFIATTRAFDLLTRAFNLATRAFSPVTRGFELVFYFSITEAYSGVFNNGSYNDITFFFFNFILQYFSAKFKRHMFFDYNDVSFNARLSLLK